MGLPPLSPAGGHTDRATRFITLDERLAEHVHATSPRVTPGRTTRESFDAAPSEPAMDEQKDEDSMTRTAAASLHARSVATVDALTRTVPRTIGVEESTYAHGEVHDVVASLHRAANFARYPVEVEAMCGGDNLQYPLPTETEFDWELFLEGLGEDFPQTDTTDIPPPSARSLWHTRRRRTVLLPASDRSSAVVNPGKTT